MTAAKIAPRTDRTSPRPPPRRSFYSGRRFGSYKGKKESAAQAIARQTPISSPPGLTRWSMRTRHELNIAANAQATPPHGLTLSRPGRGRRANAVSAPGEGRAPGVKKGPHPRRFARDLSRGGRGRQEKRSRSACLSQPALERLPAERQSLDASSLGRRRGCFEDRRGLAR